MAKSTSWNLIKGDYGVEQQESSSDSDFEASASTSTNRVVSVVPTVLNQKAPAKAEDCQMKDPKNIVDDLKNVKNNLSSLAVDKSGEIKECLKCNICYELNFFMYFCPKCGSLAGCFLCCYRLQSCPLCRGLFPIKKERVPQFIPNLAGACGSKAVTLSELKENLTSLDNLPQTTTSISSDDDYMD